LAQSLSPGDVVLVSGELGSGKTTFVRGACRELGVKGPVVSPTFAVGRRYAGRVPVSHLDLYRLESLAAEDPGLLDDYLTPDAVAFVEWPSAGEREVEGLVGDRAGRVLRVRIGHAGGDEREIEVD
jgi:tRNA threonylcarbamoyladenosine biosynthesis protein TsaE